MLEPLESDYSGQKGRFSKSSDNSKQSNSSNSNSFRLQRHQSHSPQKAAKVRPPSQLHPEPPEQERNIRNLSTRTGGHQGQGQSPHKTVKVQHRDKETPAKTGSTRRRGDQGVSPSRAQKPTSRSPRRPGVKVRGAAGGKTPAKTKPSFSPKAGLAQCRVCSRSFAEERIQVHTNICTKTRANKRKPYDVVKVNV